MRTKKGVKRKQVVCIKCGALERCHICGREKDNRGWYKTFKLTKNGPEHCICPSCAE